MTSNMQFGHCYSLQTEFIGGLVASVQTMLLAAEQFIPIFYHNDSGLIFCKLVNPLPSDLHSAEGELFKVASEAAIIMSDSRHELFRKCKLKSVSFTEAPNRHCI